LPGPKKKQIDLGGRNVDAVPIPIVGEQEFWNSYQLEDGSIVRIKLVAQEILRVDGMWDADGNPVYVVRSTNVTSVDGNEALRRPPE
jgi:hypothetical protein